MTAPLKFDPPLTADETEWLDRSIGRARGGVRDVVAAAVLRGPWILMDVMDWRVSLRRHIDRDLTLELVIWRGWNGRFGSSELRAVLVPFVRVGRGMHPVLNLVDEIHTVNRARSIAHTLELVTP